MFISFDRIPDKVFFKVELVRDVYKVIVNKYSQIQKGSPEVEVISPLGFKDVTTKLELLKYYSLLNGKKIKMVGIKCNTPIAVMGSWNRQMFATYIPTNCTVEFLDDDEIGKVSGKYIVCESTPDGLPDKSQYYVVNKNLFQKIFVMYGDINSLFSEDKEFGDFDEADNNLYTGASADYENINGEQNYSDQDDQGYDGYNGQGYDGYNEQGYGGYNDQGYGGYNGQDATLQISEEFNGIPKENKYKVIAKVVDSNKKLVAIKLEDKNTGEVENVPITFLPTYIKEDGIDNVYLEYKDDKPIIKYRR